MDWAPSREVLDYFSRETAHLRSGQETHWTEARDHLREAGVVPEDAAVVELVDEGYPMESVVAITRDGRVFDFNIIRWIDPELPRGHGHVTGWNELPPEETNVAARGRHDLWTQYRRIAQAIFEREGQAPDAQ